MREFRLGLAHRTARGAPLRYKLAGAVIAFLCYCVLVPAVSLFVDPYSQSILALVLIGVGSAAFLVWAYYVTTGMLARRRVLE